MSDKSKPDSPLTDALIRSLEDGHISIWDALTAIQDHARDLETRLAKAEEDAARYRWMRSWAGRSEQFPVHLENPETPEDMDRQIDGEILREKEKSHE